MNIQTKKLLQIAGVAGTSIAIGVTSSVIGASAETMPGTNQVSQSPAIQNVDLSYAQISDKQFAFSISTSGNTTQASVSRYVWQNPYGGSSESENAFASTNKPFYWQGWHYNPTAGSGYYVE